MKKIFDNFEEYALLLLFPIMVVVVFLAMLARYFKLFPMFWGEEVARYIMVFMAYIGTGAAMKRGAHVGVSFFTDKIVNPRLRIALEGLRIGIILFFCCAVLYYYRGIISHQIFMGQTTPALFIPMWVPYSAVPLGMFLVAVRAVQAFRAAVRDIRSTEAA